MNKIKWALHRGEIIAVEVFRVFKETVKCRTSAGKYIRIPRDNLFSSRREAELKELSGNGKKMDIV